MAREYTEKELIEKIKKFEVGVGKASDKNEKAQFEKGLATFKKKLEAFEKEVEKPTIKPSRSRKPQKNKPSRSRKPQKNKPVATKSTPKKEGTWQDFVKANKGTGKGLKELAVEWKGGKKTPSKKAPAKATTKKPAKAITKTPSKKGGKRGISVVNSKTVMVDGTEMKMDSKEFCSVLLDKWKGRRNKSKSKAKTKTTSVMSRVTTNIEKGIKQAIKGGVDTQKKAINKNPKPFFNKISKLESSTKDFLSSLKAVMGAEYEQSDIAKTMKVIEDFVADLKEKIEK